MSASPAKALAAPNSVARTIPDRSSDLFFCIDLFAVDYFLVFFAASSSNAAWAAARRATGTRNGEQLT